MQLPQVDLTSRAHYLKPAGRTHTPAAVICLDSETRHHYQGSDEIHTLRCWSACFTRRRDRRRPGEISWAAGTTVRQSADVVDAWAGSVESAWLYAHNVTFDMVTTDLPAQLAARGWVISSRFGLSGGSMWCVLHKGRREAPRSDRPSRNGRPEMRVKWAHTLTIADSASIWFTPLAELAPMTGVSKPPLPADGDSAWVWAYRCYSDVRILTRLILPLMDWWDANDMGPWSVTGAGLGWQTYRQTLTLRQMVIDHDPAVLAWERQAVYGGRRDVFRVGELTPGRYGEVDYEGAYPTIAANCPLPAKLACAITDMHRRLAMRGKVPIGMLAEVTITTGAGRWPVRTKNGVFYPVGTFRTVLAAPDIQAAADAGALAAVHDGYLYTMTRHLRPWAQRVLSWAKGTDASVPGPVRAAAKLWSRAVIGKFAQRGWRTIPWVGPPESGWCVEDTSDLYTGQRGVITGLAGIYYLSWADQPGEHERPALLAFVEAHVRARLGLVIAGPFGAAVIQCDTDGLMVSHTDLRKLAAKYGRTWRKGKNLPWGTAEILTQWNEASWPLVMRDKTQFRRAVVYGPQHVKLDGRPRFAGVPKGAWPTGEGRWAARLWPGLLWQSQHGPPGGFARPVQGYLVVGPYAAGWVLDDGVVRAAEATLDEEGSVTMLPWEKTRWAAAGDRLGPRQARWAEGLWEGDQDGQGNRRAADNRAEPAQRGHGSVGTAPESVPAVPAADRNP